MRVFEFSRNLEGYVGTRIDKNTDFAQFRGAFWILKLIKVMANGS